MKKAIALLLALTILCMAGCSKKEEQPAPTTVTDLNLSMQQAKVIALDRAFPIIEIIVVICLLFTLILTRKMICLQYSMVFTLCFNAFIKIL